jgi:hypothetical protein
MCSLREISLAVHILTSLPDTTTQYRNMTSLAVYPAPLTPQPLASQTPSVYVPPSAFTLHKNFLQFVPHRELYAYILNANQLMLYSGVHSHCDERGEQINTKHGKNVQFKSDRTGGTHTNQSTRYHKHSTKHALTCSLSVTTNSANLSPCRHQTTSRS